MRWLFIIFLFSYSSESQGHLQPDTRIKKEIPGSSSLRTDPQHFKVFTAFKMIEHGIQRCSIDEFKKDFGSIVTIAIGSGERGYYSMNQAASVLSEFFSGRRPVSFEFSRIHEKGPAPYATGRFIYIQKGNQESVQIYVSLTRQDSRWVINQFNIY